MSASIRKTAVELIQSGQPAAAERLLRSNLADRDCAALLRERLIGDQRLTAAVSVARQLLGGDDAEALVSAAFLRQLGNDFEQAMALCRQALQRAPDHPTALNHLGRALLALGRNEEALAMFKRATAAAPRYAEAWHNLGQLQRARGQLRRAQSAFEHALKHAPGLLSARLQLGITLAAMENASQALSCFDQVLQQAPDDLQARSGAGVALHRLGQLSDARTHFEHALRIAPEQAAPRYYLGCVLNQMRDHRGAIAALQQALDLQPDDADAWAELVMAHEQLNQFDAAAEALARGLEAAPEHAHLQLAAAKLERRRGNPDAAVDRLQQIDPRALPAPIAQLYWFELGQACDRCDDLAGAMRAFESGNALAARTLRRHAIDPATFKRQLDQLLHWMSEGAAGAEPQASDPGDDRGSDLCFLIGLPRAGASVLQRRLAAHPQIGSIDETPTLEHAIQAHAGLTEHYPDSMAQLGAEDIRALRLSYRQIVADLLGDRQFTMIVDRLPLRFLHAGLIRRLFPDARLLFVQRHPCDMVLSNFMHPRPTGEAAIHFNTLADSARTGSRVLQLWQLSRDTLQLRSDSVRYETLIEDPPAELARVCGFLGLGLDPAMLGESAAAMAPLDPHGVGRWHRYRSYLESYFELLQPMAKQLGYRFD